MVRYADDFVILCRSEADAEQALALVAAWTQTRGLTLHPAKTRIVDATHAEALTFWATTSNGAMRWPRTKSLTKLKDTHARQDAAHQRADPGRHHRRRESHAAGLVWLLPTQSPHDRSATLDGWIRMRLRSILRKRAGRRGRGRGRDHQRWPNAFFAEQGLFCLTTAHASMLSIPHR